MMAIDTTLIEPASGRLDIGSWPRHPARPTATAMPYVPALDGLRALAVAAVLLYHGDVSWMPGGFLGVEVFFVISGYLITALLLAERQSTGGTAFLQFWARRARRLLPALFALLAAVAMVWLVWHPDEVARIRGDLAASLGYVTNWYQIIVAAVLRRGARPAVAAAAPLVAGGRGAVLPGVAGGARAAGEGHPGSSHADGDRHGRARRRLRRSSAPRCSRPASTRCGRTTAPTPAPPACCSAPRWPSPRHRGRCAGTSAVVAAGCSRWLGRRRPRRHRVDVRAGQRVRPLRLPRRLRAARPFTLAVIAALVHPGSPASVGAWARARLGSAGVDRSPLLRHLPVALADLRAHPARPRRRSVGLVRLGLATAGCCASGSPSSSPSCPTSSSRCRCATGGCGPGSTAARRCPLDPSHRPVPPGLGRRRRGGGDGRRRHRPGAGAPPARADRRRRPGRRRHRRPGQRHRPGRRRPILDHGGDDAAADDRGVPPPPPPTLPPIVPMPGQEITAIGDSVLLGSRHWVNQQFPGVLINAEVGRQFNVLPDLLPALRTTARCARW